MPGIDDNAKITGSKDAKFISDLDLTLTTGFQSRAFGFNATSIIISNDHATNYIEYSWNGTDVHGKLFKGETLFLSRISRSNIYLRGQAGGEEFRVWAW